MRVEEPLRRAKHATSATNLSLSLPFFRLQEALQRNAELASSSLNAVSTVSVIYDVHNGDRRPANLVRSFGDLYSQARLETLDALDAIDELIDADELKNKLLFSVVVVSLLSKGNYFVCKIQGSVCRM